MDQPPLVAERAIGDLIYDPDGHAYIDYCGSWGAMIHGHAHPEIVNVAKKRLSLGSSFGITTQIEEQLARYVVNLIDSIEKIRFVSSGTEATMSAIRLARGFTGRELIIKFSGNYHGHADFFLVQSGSGVAGFFLKHLLWAFRKILLRIQFACLIMMLKSAERYFKIQGIKIALQLLF